MSNKFTQITFPIQRAIVRKLVKLPDSVLGKIAGKPIVIDGNRFNVPLQALLKLFAPPPNHLASVAETRAEFDEQGAWLSQDPNPDIRKTDHQIPVSNGNIQIRVYRPKHHDGKILPVLVFYHGGGYAAGSLKSHDLPCQAIAYDADCAVIAVAYRLAPEYPFPTPVNDGIEAFRHIARHADNFGINPTRVAVGGDSAGGNLAAVVAQQTKNDNIAPIAQLLWVPWLDMSDERESYEKFATGFFLERAKMRWYTDLYLTDEKDKTNPLASPIYGDTVGVAPALVMVGGFDPLRDEGIEYANKMQDDGVDVTLIVVKSMPHVFINVAGGIKDAQVAFKQATDFLRKSFKIS